MAPWKSSKQISLLFITNEITISQLACYFLTVCPVAAWCQCFVSVFGNQNDQLWSEYSRLWDVVSLVNTPTSSAFATAVSLGNWHPACPLCLAQGHSGSKDLKYGISKLWRRPKRSVCLLGKLQLKICCISKKKTHRYNQRRQPIRGRVGLQKSSGIRNNALNTTVNVILKTVIRT